MASKTDGKTWNYISIVLIMVESKPKILNRVLEYNRVRGNIENLVKIKGRS